MYLSTQGDCKLTLYHFVAESGYIYSIINKQTTNDWLWIN